MPLPDILGGFETLKKHFFEIFGAKEQKEKTGKSRKKSGKIGIIDISVDISYRSPPISKFCRYFGRNFGNFVPWLGYFFLFFLLGKLTY